MGDDAPRDHALDHEGRLGRIQFAARHDEAEHHGLHGVRIERPVLHELENVIHRSLRCACSCRCGLRFRLVDFLRRIRGCERRAQVGDGHRRVTNLTPMHPRSYGSRRRPAVGWRDYAPLIRPTRYSSANSQPPIITAAKAPAICAITNGATLAGAMPANVSESERAAVTAGLENDVEAVNQYAAVM